MVTFKQISADKKHAVALLERLQLACLSEDEPYFPDKGWWWIGYANKQPIAFCLLVPSSQWLDTVYMARAGVLFLWRGKGLHKRMITIRESFARQKGYTWAVTDTTDNPQSANNLARKGYQMYDPSYKWAYDHSLYWRKRLKDAI